MGRPGRKPGSDLLVGTLQRRLLNDPLGIQSELLDAAVPCPQPFGELVARLLEECARGACIC